MMENAFCFRSRVTLSIVSYTFIPGRPSPLLLFYFATHKLCTNILLQGLMVQHYSSMYLSIASRWRLQEAHNFSLERGKVLDALKNATIFPMLDSGRPPIELHYSRPLVLNDSLWKMMKEIILRRIMAIMSSGNSILRYAWAAFHLDVLYLAM